MQPFIINEIDEVAFPHSPYQVFFQIYKEELQNGHIPDEHFFLQHNNQTIRQQAIDLLIDKHVISDNWEEKHQIYSQKKFKPENMYKLINYYKLLFIKYLIEQNQKALQNTQLDETEQIQHLQKHRELSDLKKTLYDLIAYN